MFTLEAVRAALLSDRPWAGLDGLVRAELARGRTTTQIYESLIAMAEEIDNTPDLSEAGSGAFGDALDALTGMCHPDCRYRDFSDESPPVGPGSTRHSTTE
jgi:hypothetical protein